MSNDDETPSEEGTADSIVEETDGMLTCVEYGDEYYEPMIREDSGQCRYCRLDESEQRAIDLADEFVELFKTDETRIDPTVGDALFDERDPDDRLVISNGVELFEYLACIQFEVDKMPKVDEYAVRLSSMDTNVEVLLDVEQMKEFRDLLESYDDILKVEGNQNVFLFL